MRRERVLNRLLAADGRWVCSRILSHPHVGGRRAAARIFELRQKDGWTVEAKACDCSQCRYSRDVALRRNERPARVAAYRIPVEAQEKAS